MLGDSLEDPHMDEDGFGDDFGRKFIFNFLLVRIIIASSRKLIR